MRASKAIGKKESQRGNFAKGMRFSSKKGRQLRKLCHCLTMREGKLGVVGVEREF